MARTGLNDPRLLRLSPDDNVCVVTAAVEAGDEIMIEGRPVAVPQPLPMGFKVAVRPIETGEKILKYGVPIGSATRPIETGELVHTDNLKSDYLPTFLLDAGNPFTGANP